MAIEAGSDLAPRIMRSAKELFFTRGYANAQLRAIAHGAGTSESGVLRLYGSKSGLLRAVYADSWAEVNESVDEALAAAAEVDPDPRNLLVELARTVWSGYWKDPAMHSFLLSQFGSRDSGGLVVDDSVAPAIDEECRREYHRYLERIQSLCREIVDDRPELGQSGVTSEALGHSVTAIVHGIQTSWFMAAQEPEAAQAPVKIEESLAVMRLFLYPETCGNTDSHGKTN